MHRNDLENIPAVLACGLLFEAVESLLRVAMLLPGLFVLARIDHTWPYVTALNHEVGAVFNLVRSIVVIVVPAWVLVVALD